MQLFIIALTFKEVFILNKQHFYKKLTALVLGGLMSFTAGSVSAANTVPILYS